MKYRILLLIISLVLLGLIVYFSNPAELAAKLSMSNPGYIIAALIVSSVSNIFRVMKWSVLVGVKFRDLFPVQMLGLTLSNFTPAKAGEPAKTILLKMRSGISVSHSLSSVVWERINDVVVLLLFSAMIVQFLSLKKDFLIVSMLSMSVFLAGIVVFLAIMKSKALGIKFFGMLRRLPLGNKLPANFAEAFYEKCISKRKIFAGLLITFVPWFLEGVVLYLSFAALGIAFPSVLVLTGMIALSALVGVASALPGGLGSFEAVMILLLAPLGVNGSSAVAGILLYRFLSFWYVALLGGLSFLYLSKKIDIKKIW